MAVYDRRKSLDEYKSDKIWHATSSVLVHEDTSPYDDWGYVFGDAPIVLEIEGGYGGDSGNDFEGRRVFLDPKQALSLLSYLEQNRSLFEKST